MKVVEVAYISVHAVSYHENKKLHEHCVLDITVDL